MSLSAVSLNLCRKRTAMEHAITNDDPLVAWKKAREAVQPNATASAPKNGVTAPNIGRRSSVHMEDDADDREMAPQSAPRSAPVATNLQRRTSVHMEDVDDDEDTRPRNVAPKNPSRLIELSDGSDDEDDPHLPQLTDVDDDEEEEEESEESAEAELSLPSSSNVLRIISSGNGL
ncbi:hypothetical protein M413DRAFT_31633 [Hebeloma cylindrosporum]|uniref:Uncharacterized protein n=1 Tax=Hebeloma cylindrosporum TaxID=76867 RepID=A0A0C2XEN5_HEBCY|nr:hypothetical protein M413DRAFT_31633 [Hebeloma cylindrosporum h7]